MTPPPKCSNPFQKKGHDSQLEEKANLQTEEDETELDFSKKDDYVCKYIENKNKRLKLATALQEVLVARAKKVMLNLSDTDHELIRISFNSNNLNSFNDFNCNSWISDFKLALSEASTRQQQK
ncbi:hypothetical protein PV328_001085 [Microctonus aethiopoides]|uniref:Uncharacterized protein n=1 Tax=Microctonus aethiopoides TaxID=144406 RepID=A0AA39FWY5_9HYME|nr:hypothetical protein PV328_001085 [Microctonus aethiopoides]